MATTEKVKTTRKMTTTQEDGNKREVEVHVNFNVELPESMQDELMVELLKDDNAADRVFTGIRSYLLNMATMAAARQVAEGGEVSEIKLLDALQPSASSRFSYKAAAQAARDKALALGSQLAAGKIDQEEFTAQHTELMAKAADFDAKHAAQQAKRKAAKTK